MNTPILAVSFNDIFTGTSADITQETSSGSVAIDSPATSTAQPFAIAGFSYWTFIMLLAVLAVLFIVLKYYLKKRFNYDKGL